MVTTSSVVPPESRPEPIRDALARVATYTGIAVAVVAFLGTKGVVSSAQVELVSGYAAVVNEWVSNFYSIVAAIGAGGGVIGAIRLAARHATGESTPSKDPRDIDGTPLMRVDGLPLGAVELPEVHPNAAPLPTSDPVVDPPTGRLEPGY